MDFSNLYYTVDLQYGVLGHQFDMFEQRLETIGGGIYGVVPTSSLDQMALIVDAGCESFEVLAYDPAVASVRLSTIEEILEAATWEHDYDDEGPLPPLYTQDDTNLMSIFQHDYSVHAVDA